MSSTLRPQTSGKPRVPGHAADHLLRQRLAGIRRKLRLVTWGRGLGWLLACVLLTLLLVGLLDYRLHLPGLFRAVVLSGLLGAAGILIYRFLLQPLSLPSDDLALALRIEERYPLLNDGLASTVQFLERTPPPGESASLRGEAVRRTLSRIDGLDFYRVVDTHGLRSALLSALAALLASALLTITFPTLAWTAVTRLASPFSSIEWPKKTQLELDKIVHKIGRNREYRLQGKVRGEIPKEVTVEVSHEGFPVQRKPFAVHPEEHTFTMHLKPEEVQRNFRFRIYANDMVSPEFKVEVLPLPMLVSLDGKPSPQLRLDPPAYTDLLPSQLPPGSGNLEVVAGTVVTLRAAVDRPLKRAWIEYQPELPGTTQAAALAVFGTQDPLGVLGNLVLSREVYEPLPATLHDDGRTLEVIFRPSTNGHYGLYFEDEHDLQSSRSYELRLRLDPAPVVRLERPSLTRDVLNVLPTASLPLQLIVEDSQFAVQSVWLEYRTRAEESPRKIVLFDLAKGMAQELGPWTGSVPRGAPVPRLRVQRLEFDRKLSLTSLRHGDGSKLKEGDVLVLQAFADDLDNVSVGKEPGKSHQITIRIVGKEELEVELNREQGRVQKELVNLRDKQREALSKVKQVEARARQGGKMIPEREASEAETQAQQLQQEAAKEQEKAEQATSESAREKHRQAAREKRLQAQKLEELAQQLKRQAMQLSEAEQLQQQIREKVGNDREGLRADLERLRETLRQNGLQNSNAMERMSQVAKELDRLADHELEQIEPRLTNAKKLSELQDEKTREERRAELEQRALASEQEAKAAEERARRLDERAAQLEKEGKRDEAERAKKQAQAEREKAAERSAQAERDRRDAQESTDPDRARRTLSEARRGQEEVERSLSKLLQELEPWSSTLEVNSEAGRILQEQKELQAQLDELTKKGLTGKSRDELTENEKADLDQAQEEQRRLQERTANLLQQMKKLAETRMSSDPETAGDLKKAAEQAEQRNLAGQMKEAQERIGRNELNQARQKQQEAVAELEKLLKNLKDSREARLDRLGRKLREAEEMVEKLMEEQEQLQRKMREAAAITDPKKREEELQRLAKKQQELAQRSEEVSKRLSALGNERAQQMMADACEEMKDAVKQLSRGKSDDEKQEDVLDRLEETRRELERARRKTEEELGREQLIRVADVIRRIRERQEGHLLEAKRIQDSVLQRKGWSRGLKASLRDLGQNQQGLAEETANVAKKDLTAAPVFARLVERSARSMEKAGSRVAGMVRESPQLDQLPDEELQREQGQALRRLDQLLASLKESLDDPRPLSRGGGGGENEDEDGGGGGGDNGLPPTAQLKLLRSMQQEVNERTASFQKKHPDLDKLHPADKLELEEIRREQQEVADLLDRLLTPPTEEPGLAQAEPEQRQEEKPQ